MSEHTDILRRLKCVEERLDKVEDRVSAQEVVDVGIKTDVKAMRNEFSLLRDDVLKVVSNHTDETWKLMNKGLKLIIVLIIVIVSLAGIKMLPELIGTMLG